MNWRKFAWALSYVAMVPMLFFIPTIAPEAGLWSVLGIGGPVAFAGGHYLWHQEHRAGKWLVGVGALGSQVWTFAFIIFVVTIPFVAGTLAMLLAAVLCWIPAKVESPMPQLPS